jgi:hypothetical protein
MEYSFFQKTVLRDSPYPNEGNLVMIFNLKGMYREETTTKRIPSTFVQKML